jgi:CubicO group peptidase (beta-lactamase class C family)
MEAFSQIIAAACAEGTIPGAVVAATNSTGSLFYTEAFGKRSLVDGQACGLDTVMAFFSVTKLVTTIAALQLVEGGKIGLDDDISKVLPELSSLPVLDEMKDGQGVLRERVQAITIR